MCGISGIWITNSKLRLKREDLNNRVLVMNRLLRHRGPDDEGVEDLGGNSPIFGHTRLSIIGDNKIGKQPAFSQNKNFVVTFNGEIYNYLEICEELGVRASSEDRSSDTKTLLSALECWGVEEAISKLQGMYSLAIWDKKKKRLYLSRDRYGEKPLYYYNSSGIVIFASEANAILSTGLAEKKLNKFAEEMFLFQGFVPERHCIFENIQKVEPSTIVIIGSCSQKTLKTRVPETVNGNAYNQDNFNLKRVFKNTFLSSLEKRMRADVDIGLFLSGGVDSSLIAWGLNELGYQNIKTFTAGVLEEGFDESRDAKLVSNRFNFENVVVPVKNIDLEHVLEAVVSNFKEPFADVSAIPTLAISERASKEYKVCLTGDGGDEFFGGYNRHFIGAGFWRFFRIANFLLPQFLANIRRFEAELYKLEERFLKGSYATGSVVQKLLKMLNSNSQGSIAEYYLYLVSHNTQNSNFFSRNPSISGELLDFDTEKAEGFYSSIINFDQKYYLPGNILKKADVCGMAHGLELRTPYLDSELLKLFEENKSFFTGRFKNKKLQKQILAEELGVQYDKPKMGFAVPIDRWISKDWQKLFDSNHDFQETGSLLGKNVRTLINNHVNGVSRNGELLWRIAILEMWKRKYIYC